MNLGDVREGFNHEQVNAAFDERLRLLAENRLGFFDGRWAVGLYANAERPDSAGYEGTVAGGFASQAHAG